MSVSDAEIAHVRDLFAPPGSITQRKMMGGATFYSNGMIVAILSSESTACLKAEGVLAQRLERAGTETFSMTRKDGHVTTMGYRALSEAALDDPATACDWARDALSAQA
ncbi:TfoX/Sxy family protein [Roseovarius sp. S4756]|uniref:TfoX/Sxy family protein n=1 Tax=Roseovarius maritimus TaxID=3342637 RepID=UPI003726A871